VCVAVGMVEMYSRIQDLVSPFNKYPPGPYSLLVFGSAALLLIRVRDLENGGDIQREVPWTPPIRPNS
jgi:hypothetical protein